MTIEFETLYTLCNTHKWFTCGGNKQYDKLFELNREDIGLQELSLVIWLCSDNVDRKEIDRILRIAVYGK